MRTKSAIWDHCNETMPEMPELPLDLWNADLVVVEELFPTTDWDDATWILTSSFIIFTMQSGFGLLESGSVSHKNEAHIMVKNAVDVVFGGLSYWMFGYGLCFGTDSGSNKFVGVGHFFVDITANKTMNETGDLFSHFFFQTSFATTATTIVSGAMVERTKLEAYVIFSFVNTIVYCIPAHWIFSEEGWLNQMGVVDIAGAGPVHLVGGVTGCVVTIMLKPRTGRYTPNEALAPMSSPTNAVFGMFMLWWGWLGFNCGSTYGITDTKWILAARSATATIMASIAGGITAITLSYVMKKRKFDVVFLINGVLGSLVSITAFCALARPWQGIIIGAVGSLIACLGGPLCEKLKIDDPVGVVPVHGMAAIWSLVAVGIFGEYNELNSNFIKYDGLIAGGLNGFKLLGIQLLAAVCIAAWTAVTAFITLKLLDITIGLRVPLHEEILGADLVEHSLNGSYDKTTSEWRDREGHLIMVVKQYENEDSMELLNRLHAGSVSCTICNQSNTSVRTRRSAFGFSRSEDSVSHASEASDGLPNLRIGNLEGDVEMDEARQTTKDNRNINNNNKKRGLSFFRKLGTPFRNGTSFRNGTASRSGRYTVNSSTIDSIPNGSIVMEPVDT